MAYTGQSLKRFEDPRLLTGQGAFLDDLTFPDMLYAAVLRSPHAHASIRAIETAAARHAPGVVAVITAEDLEGVVEPLPTRRETEAQELRPPVHPILARLEAGILGVVRGIELDVDGRPSGNRARDAGERGYGVGGDSRCAAERRPAAEPCLTCISGAG